MKPYNLLRRVCLFLKQDDLVEELDSLIADIEAETTTHSLNSNTLTFRNLNEKQKQLYYMLSFAEATIQEIATDYFPLVISESVTSDGECKILYSALQKPIRSVVRIEDDNAVCTFNDYVTFLKVGKPNHEYNITYAYYPTAVMNFIGDFETAPYVSERHVAYKVCSEYCFANSLFDESVMWNKRFVEDLNLLKNSLAEKKLNSFPLY